MAVESIKSYLENRIKSDKESDNVDFFTKSAIQKAYYIGAYSRAVIQSSYNSEVSKNNTTFKKWLSNQIISFKNLDRIYEMAFRFEQKLCLKIRNNSEVRTLAHEVPNSKSTGISNAKVSFAFVAGFDDYQKFIKENPSNKNEETNQDGGNND